VEQLRLEVELLTGMEFDTREFMRPLEAPELELRRQRLVAILDATPKAE
jgi:hypothetical protein